MCILALKMDYATTSVASRNSVARKSESDSQDWENHLVIRFPPEIAQKIRDYLDEDTQHGIDTTRLNVSFNSNLRTGTVKFDKHEMDFMLYDLPCITEVPFLSLAL
jgi:hypothetical protein